MVCSTANILENMWVHAMVAAHLHADTFYKLHLEGIVVQSLQLAGRSWPSHCRCGASGSSTLCSGNVPLDPLRPAPDANTLIQPQELEASTLVPPVDPCSKQVLGHLSGLWLTEADVTALVWADVNTSFCAAVWWTQRWLACNQPQIWRLWGLAPC